MAARHDDRVHVMETPPPTSVVASWMTIGEARAALVAAGQRALPVAGHDGLIGLITIEALSGGTDDAVPDPDEPVLAVMDWHLVQLAPDADDDRVGEAFAAAAQAWIVDRRRDTQARHARPHRAPPGPDEEER